MSSGTWPTNILSGNWPSGKPCGCCWASSCAAWPCGCTTCPFAWISGAFFKACKSSLFKSLNNASISLSKSSSSKSSSAIACACGCWFCWALATICSLLCADSIICSISIICSLLCSESLETIKSPYFNPKSSSTSSLLWVAPGTGAGPTLGGAGT